MRTIPMVQYHCARPSLTHFRKILLTLLLLVCVPPSKADLFSVAFNSPNQFGASPLISGPDPASTSADPLFGAANVWNNLNIPFGVVVTNPSWNNLVDSSGTATGVDFSIEGGVAGVDFNYVAGLNPLRSEAAAWNISLPDSSSTISWTLSGLASNATYDMCVYGAQDDAYYRSFNMTIQNTTLNVASSPGTSQPTQCILFTGLQSDSNGVITGVGTSIGDPSVHTSEADWAGFQLVEVDAPEPSTLLLLGTGSMALIGKLRNRRR